MSWSKLSEKNLLKPYNTGCKNSSKYSNRDEKYQHFCEMTKDIEYELKSYSFKYFIFHITLFMTRNVNIKSEWTYAHYNAAGRTFLFDFMECFYSKQVARRIIQAMEKAIADFNYETLEFTDQNPLQTFLAPSFKNETDEYKIDMVAFIKGLSDKDKDFKDFIKYSYPMHRIGQKLNGMNNEYSEKDVMMTKMNALKEAKKVIYYSKKKELLKGEFELLNKNCAVSKHVVISVSGLLSERSNLTQKWDEFNKTNPSLPIYAYRWAAQSEIPTWKSFLPSVWSLFSIKKWFAKSFLAYQAIKIPYDYRKKFIKMIDLAKEYGKLLAYMLILQFPFTNQSISLIGFELGAQIVYSCLEELHRQKADNIIHNVYFIRGAVAVGSGKQWAKILQVVQGTVYNYYCSGDKILYLFKTIVMKTPIGITPLLDIEYGEKMSEKEVKRGEKFRKLRSDIRVVNVDANKPTPELKKYKDEFAKTLAAVHF